MIFVAGFEPNNCNPEILSLLKRCSAIFASKRFQESLNGYSHRLRSIVPVKKMLEEIHELKKHGDVLVLASGDPLFFGIGRRFLEHFERRELTFLPSLTSVQRACARFGLPWDDMECVSLHGRNKRDLRGLLKKILTNNRFKVAVFTDNRNSPDQIAKRLMEKGLEDARFLVAEDIGGKDEAFWELSIKDASSKRFHPLNLLIIMGQHKRQNMAFGLGEDSFVHEKGLITKAEVRSVILSRLGLSNAHVLWDIGAGSGSVSIEASLLAPHLAIFSVEAKPERCLHLYENKKRFLALNMEIVEGTAPGCLKGLPRPDRIFIGGGLSTDGLLETCWDLLEPGGILVGSTILIESLDKAMTFSRKRNLEPELVRIETSHARRLGTGTFFSPAPAITLFRLCK